MTDKRLRGLDTAWSKVHLVGIGGAGMSAIARVLKEGGLEVSGSDLQESAALSALRTLGIRVDVGHHPRHASGADVLVVSAAVAEDNPEVMSARQDGVPIVPRGRALAMIIKGLRTVAVSGTHGKTTTSGMVATILEKAGVDPTYLLGADIAARGAGGRLGGGGVAVVEADEAYGSFLWLHPTVAVVTNIDEDHLDHYGTRKSLDEAFVRFMSQAAEAVICCSENEPAMEAGRRFRPIKYGFSKEDDVFGTEVKTGASSSDFELSVAGKTAHVRLGIGGLHNVLNALGAAAACSFLGVETPQIVEGLQAFSGVSRRFEYRGSFGGADVIDDYAHHPAEVDATLLAARQGPWRRVVAVFQPHLYSRTQALWRQFGRSLSRADLVVVTDVYGAREQPLPGVTGKLIVDSVCESSPGKRVAYLPRLDEAAEYLRLALRPGDLLLGLGAGDVTTLPDRLPVT